MVAAAPAGTGHGPCRANHRQLEQLLGLQQQLLGQVPTALQIIQASAGNQIHMVRVQDIVYLEAADKYLRVLTAARSI